MHRQIAAQLGDISLRWCAKEFFVLAAEIRRIFVANAKAGTGDVHIFA